VSLDLFAERYLFSPLGITDYFWQKVGNGAVNTYGGLRLRPRDMAKIGQLFLDGGRWQGQQVVSEEWVAESTKLRIGNAFPGWVKADGYGYQWWLETFEVGPRRYSSYSARGRGGQYIIVVPELKLVVVVTSWNNDVRLLRQPLDMAEGVLRSMKYEV
jgi:CubicO group peptidase (beta-lactamase class C family)